MVEVAEGSPAQRAGLRPEDLIVELGGRAVERADDVQRLMGESAIGTPLTARVLRGERWFDLELRHIIVEIPDGLKVKPAGRLAVMLQAYFDESGTHVGAPALVVAGYLFEPDPCLALAREWRAGLAASGVFYL